MWKIFRSLTSPFPLFQSLGFGNSSIVASVSTDHLTSDIELNTVLADR